MSTLDLAADLAAPALFILSTDERPRVLFATEGSRRMQGIADPAGGTPLKDASGRALPPDERPASHVASGRRLAPRFLTARFDDADVSILVGVEVFEARGGRLAAMTITDVSRLIDHAASLEEALAARDDFLSVAAHELRSPLNVLSLATHSLLSRIGAATVPADFEKLIRTVRRQSDRLTNLVQNLLDVTRIQTNQFELERERCDLCAIVADAVSVLHETALGAEVELSFSRCEPIDGQWDRVRIEQVVQNLVGNAIKYAAPGRVDVSLRRDGASAVLQVDDDGPGIAPENRMRVFERFERVASRATKQSLGLGLYIVRQIVEGHGGAVSIEEGPRPGACVVVRLPIVSSERSGGDDAGG